MDGVEECTLTYSPNIHTRTHKNTSPSPSPFFLVRSHPPHHTYPTPRFVFQLESDHSVALCFHDSRDSAEVLEIKRAIADAFSVNVQVSASGSGTAMQVRLRETYWAAAMPR